VKGDGERRGKNPLSYHPRPELKNGRVGKLKVQRREREEKENKGARGRRK